VYVNDHVFRQHPVEGGRPTQTLTVYGEFSCDQAPLRGLRKESGSAGGSLFRLYPGRRKLAYNALTHDPDYAHILDLCIGGSFCRMAHRGLLEHGHEDRGHGQRPQPDMGNGP